jgi:hypothetical protein
LSGDKSDNEIDENGENDDNGRGNGDAAPPPEELPTQLRDSSHRGYSLVRFAANN